MRGALLLTVLAVACQEPAPVLPVDAGPDEPDSGGPELPPEPDPPRFEDWPCRPGWLPEVAAPEQPWSPSRACGGCPGT